MPRDLKIIEPIGTDRVLKLKIGTVPAAADGQFSLVQKIVKNLLTEPGDDEFEPDLGGGLRGSLAGIQGSEVARATQAAAGALRKCLEDIQSDQGPDPKQRLLDLRVSRLTFSAAETLWTLVVEVVTEAGTFAMPVSTGA